MKKISSNPHPNRIKEFHARLHDVRALLSQRESIKTFSFTQFSTFYTCNHHWYLRYVKKAAKSLPSINTIFGTAIHNTVQTYLEECYEQSVKKIDEKDLNGPFLSNFFKAYGDESRIWKREFATEQEFRDFYGEGTLILDEFKRKKTDYFSFRDYVLIGNEIPILYAVRPGLYFEGYIDTLVYNKKTDTLLIFDYKTSKHGWSEEDRSNDFKLIQIYLYHHFLSHILEFDPNRIKVCFLIFRRQPRSSEYTTIPHIQEYRPLFGPRKEKKFQQIFMGFIERVFDENNEYVEAHYPKMPSTFGCRYCPFNEKPELCDKKQE